MGFGTSKQQSAQQSTSTQSNVSNSESHNQAYPTLSTQLSPTIEGGSSAGNAIRALLGLDGGGAHDEAFNNYLGSTGYQFQKDQGVGSITGSQAAKGLLSSGSTLKSLTSFGQGLASQYLDKYLAQLTGQQSSGLTAAQTLAGAGQTSSSSSVGTGSSQSTGDSKGSSMNFTFGS